MECRKDEGVLDEIPGAYKSIDAVMAAQLSSFNRRWGAQTVPASLLWVGSSNGLGHRYM